MADKTEASTELAVFNPNESAFPVLFADGEGGIKEVLEENFGDEGFQAGDLDKIKIPAAGGRFWDIPDEAPQATIEGVIVHKQKTRSYWVAALGEGSDDGGTPPDCASADGILGNGMFGPGSPGNPSGACEKCPMNAFGSGPNNSKACKEQQQVFLLQEGAILPIQFQLPPTSLKDFRKYMTRLASKSKAYFAVVTSFGLRQEKGPAGPYSVAVPSFVRDLAPEEKVAAKEYGATIRGSFEAMQRARDDARQAGDDDGYGDVGADGIIEVNTAD